MPISAPRSDSQWLVTSAAVEAARAAKVPETRNYLETIRNRGYRYVGPFELGSPLRINDQSRWASRLSSRDMHNRFSGSELLALMVFLNE